MPIVEQIIFVCQIAQEWAMGGIIANIYAQFVINY